MNEYIGDRKIEPHVTLYYFYQLCLGDNDGDIWDILTTNHSSKR